MPMGLQIVGRALAEFDVVSDAAALEQTTPKTQAALLELPNRSGY